MFLKKLCFYRLSN